MKNLTKLMARHVLRVHIMGEAPIYYYNEKDVNEALIEAIDAWLVEHEDYVLAYEPSQESDEYDFKKGTYKMTEAYWVLVPKALRKDLHLEDF